MGSMMGFGGMQPSNQMQMMMSAFFNGMGMRMNQSGVGQPNLTVFPKPALGSVADPALLNRCQSLGDLGDHGAGGEGHPRADSESDLNQPQSL